MLTSEYSRAILLLKSGNAEEAAYILTRIVERFPRYAAAQVALAKAVSQSGGAKEALLQWSKAEALLHGSESVRSGFRLAADRVFAESEAPARQPGLEGETHHHEAATDQHEQKRTEEGAEPQPASPALAYGIYADEAADHGAVTEGAEEAREDALAEEDRGFDLLRQADEDYREEPEWEDGAPTSHAEPRSGIHPTSTADVDAPEAADPTGPIEISAQEKQPPPPDDQPEWQESGATLPYSRSGGEELPEWESSSAESGDGSDADFNLNLDSSAGDVELDRLIDELETARIVPRPDLDAVPEPDLTTDIEDVVSETLARIYATQKQFGEAARVYDRLALENPDRAGEFEDKAAEMRRRL